MMSQDLSPGQLYDVHNKIKISKKSTGWAYIFIKTLGTYRILFGVYSKHSRFRLMLNPMLDHL